MRNKLISIIPYQYRCKKCNRQTNVIYKVDDETYCDLCVPEEYKDLPALDGKGEPYNG